MIELSKLSPNDVGRWVIYQDQSTPKFDRGRIKSWNDRFIFVVYHCNGDWSQFDKSATSLPVTMWHD